MQHSSAVSLLLIVVHLFATMAFLTGVSAETEIGRLTLLTSRPFTSQVTSVGVRERPNHRVTEGSFEIPTKNKPISASAATAPFNSPINSTLPLASSFTGKGRKRTTTLTTEEEKTRTSLDTSPSRPHLCTSTTPPDCLLHLMKRGIKLSNAVVDLYGNGSYDAHSSRDANDERPSKLFTNVTIEEDEEVCIFFKFHFLTEFFFFFYYLYL